MHRFCTEHTRTMLVISGALTPISLITDSMAASQTHGWRWRGCREAVKYVYFAHWRGGIAMGDDGRFWLMMASPHTPKLHTLQADES